MKQKHCRKLSADTRRASGREIETALELGPVPDRAQIQFQEKERKRGRKRKSFRYGWRERFRGLR